MTAEVTQQPRTGIGSGSVLLREGADLPASVHFKTKPYRPGWKMIERLRPAEIDRELSKAGWHFFFLASEILAGGLALSRERAIFKAVGDLLRHAGREKVNAFEISEITTRSSTGLHYAVARGHLRHIQESPLLFRTEPRATASQLRRVA